MWDPGAELILRLCLFSFICLTVTDCRLLPVTTKRTQKKNEYVLPKDFLERGKSLLASIKIPNREFCAEMTLQPEDHYVVLPWWYNYCQDLKDKHSKGIRGNVHYTAIHKYILDEVQAYKKRLKEKQHKMSKLEMELAAMS